MAIPSTSRPRGGFAVVDASDPADPRVLAERRGLLADRPEGPLTGIHDAAVAGDRLLVVGPAGSVEGTPEAALLFDISDRTSPRRTGVYLAEGLVHNGFLAEGVAYLCVVDEEVNPLVVLDAETQRELGRWSLPAHDSTWAEVPAGARPIHDVYVQAGRAYVALWDAGTWILDVREPANPGVVASIGGRPLETLTSVVDVGAAFRELPGNHHYAAPNGDGTVLAIGKEAWDDPSTSKRGGPAGIVPWDIDDLDAPKRLATLAPPSTPDPTRNGVWTHAHNFDFDDGRLYTAWNRGGLRVYDVSDPAAPRRVAAWRDGSGGGFFEEGRASFWTAQSAPGSFFVASSWVTHDGSGDARLFTFPDPPRNRSDGTDRTRTRTERGTDTGTHTGEARTSADDTRATDGGAASTTVNAPGFGAGAGLSGTTAGIGTALWRARRRRADSEE